MLTAETKRAIGVDPEVQTEVHTYEVEPGEILKGLGMHSSLKQLRPEFQARGWPAIRIGVGVNSGRMSVGNMESRIPLAYTVIGGCRKSCVAAGKHHQAVRC
jgi:hypothetical protein